MVVAMRRVSDVEKTVMEFINPLNSEELESGPAVTIETSCSRTGDLGYLHYSSTGLGHEEI